MTSAKADTHAGLFVKLLRRSIVGILLIQQQKHRIVLPVLLRLQMLLRDADSHFSQKDQRLLLILLQPLDRRLQIQIAPDADRIADPDKLPRRKPSYRDLIKQ